MRYLGGKSKIFKFLIPIIKSFYTNQDYYLEPFMGACNVLANIDLPIKKYGCDKHYELVAMWKKLQEGWIPPDIVTKEDYDFIRKNGDDYLKGFVGFGCSFGGKYFGGYAGANEERNYALNARNSVLKKIKLMQSTNFNCRDYKTLNPSNALIYLDPPYANTTGYSVEFNSEEFWNWCRKYSTNNTILISEYKAPEDFECVWSKNVKTDMNSIDGKLDRVEKLFKLKNIL